jgi:hypothetical protein
MREYRFPECFEIVELGAKMNKLLLGVTGLAALVMTSGASAALKLTLSQSGFADVTVNESVDGFVEFEGDFGTFTATAFTDGVDSFGLGVPATTFPELLHFNAVVQGSGILTMTLTEDDMSGDYNNLFLGAGGSFTGNGTSFSVQAIQDGITYDLGPLTLSGFSGDTLGNIDLQTDSNYSLSLTAVIDHSGGASTSSFDATVNVTEPSILALMGIGLIGLAGFSRRNKI